MKNETCGVSIKSFVELKPKMHTFATEEIINLKKQKTLRERRQLGFFLTLNGNLVISGWVGLAYDR